MNRQTDYPLAKLREMLKGGTPSDSPAPGSLCPGLSNGLPIGMALNEIGLIFLAGGDEAKEAETMLLELLDGDHEGRRRLAYFYFLLRGPDALSAEAQEKIAAFDSAPQNAESVKVVKDQAAAYAS